MTTVKTGLFHTSSELSNRLVVDMSEKMRLLQPDEQQFRVALSQIAQKPATAVTIDWLEDEYVPRVSALAASAASADTALTVTSGDGNTVFRTGDIVRIMETGEGFLVTATSANSIGGTRSWGGAAAASATSVAKLVIVGNASAQGASSGTSQIVQKVLGYNYVQDQRNPLYFSDFETASNLYGGREPGVEVAKKMVEHGRALENSFFWGARDANTAASPGPLGSSGGALEYISTNITTANTAGLSPTAFDTFLEGPYGYGSKNKALFCAPRVGTVLSQMLRSAWQPVTVGEKKYGAFVNGYISGTYGWTIPVFVKREWADFDKTGTNYGTYAFLIDMEYVRLRFLQDIGTTRLRREIQEPSSTSIVHEVRSCFSLEFSHEKVHGILKGVTAYAAT